MRQFKTEYSRLRLLATGAAFGGLCVAVWLHPQVFSWNQWQAEIRQGWQLRVRREESPWPPPEFQQPCGWSYLRVDDEDGWVTGPVGTYESLGRSLDSCRNALDEQVVVRELVVPIFPSVFRPVMMDKLYYDALLASDMKEGDKVLVIGAGSGADSWVTSLKTKSKVYALDINPMAIVNAKATAKLANFQLEAVTGDIRNAQLPATFQDFDFVVWNMPFLEGVGIVNQRFHDGDNGDILKDFLARLPSLLNSDGKAILLNVAAAREFFHMPGVTTETDGRVTLFTVPCPDKSAR